MKYTVLLLLTVLTLQAAAQTPDSLTRCGVNSAFMEKNIDLELLHQMQIQWEDYAQHSKSNGRLSGDDPVLVVPVMFHIAHRGESVGFGSNVSESQIQAALANLNNIFRARGNYAAGNDTRIEFVLANCSGIDRADASGVSNFSAQGVIWTDYNQQQQVRALFGTYQDKVVNIYVSHAISGAGGFASYGGDMFILASEFPRVSSSNAKSLTFAHEMGHCLFLSHTFEGDNSCLGCANDNIVCPANDNPLTEGDQVADTPPHRVFDLNYNTPANANNTCTGQPFSEGLVRNHMAYYTNADRFTPGQVTRMRFFLENYLTRWLTSDAIPTPNNQLSLSSVPSSVCANSNVTVGYVNNSGSPNPVLLVQKGDDVVHYADASDGLINFTFPAYYFNVNPATGILPSGNDYRVRLVAGCNSTLSNTFQYNNVPAYTASIVGPDGEPLPNTNTKTDGSVTLCSGSSLTLKARLTYTQNGIEYRVSGPELADLDFQWSLNGNNLPNATGSSYTVNGQQGTYRYTVAKSGCTNQGITSYGILVDFNPTSYAGTSDFDNGKIPLKTQCTGSTLKLYSTYISNTATYKWYKDEVLLAGETGRTLLAGSSGTYKVVPSDGSCPFVMPGNKGIAITIGNALENYIRPPVDSLLCNTYTYLFSVGWAEGLSYQWLRNGAEIPNAYLSSFGTNQEGVYSLRLRQGNCESVSNAVRLYQSDKEQKPIILAPKDFGNGVSYYISMSNPNNNQQWYKDGQSIPGAYNSNLKISTSGVYTVRKGYGTCTVESDPLTVNFGNDLAPTILGEDSVRLVCNNLSTSTFLRFDGSFIENGSGLSYRWMKDGTDLPLYNYYADKPFLQTYEDGVYRLRVSNSYSSGISNPITVSSVNHQTVRLAAETGLQSACTGNVIKLNFPMTSLIDPFLIWKRDDTPIPNQHQTELTVLQSGTYTAFYQGDGCTITTDAIDVRIDSDRVSATLSGDYTIRAGESANLTLHTATGFNYFFKLSDGSEYVGGENTMLIPKSPNLSTPYAITSFGTHCGLGNISGMAQIDVTKCPVDAVNYTLTSGFWDTASNWSCGSVPTALDPVRISPSHTIHLSPYYEAKSKSIELQGQLQQGTDTKLHLGQD